MNRIYIMRLTFLFIIIFCFSATGTEWDIDLSGMDRDLELRFKDAPKSLVDWDNLDYDNSLNFDYWKKQRSFKDNNPDWKINARFKQLPERIGKVIKCSGKCEVFHSKDPLPVKVLSTIREGDELQTGSDSFLWVMLANGGILRLSSRSSVTLNEINFSSTRSFFNMRLNRGHVKYQPREAGSFNSLNLPETDTIFRPLPVREANRLFYAIKEFNQVDSSKKALYETLSNPGFNSQYLALNKLISPDKSLISKLDAKALVTTPNVTMKTMNLGLDLFYEPNGKTLFRLTDKVFNLKKAGEKEVSYEVFNRRNNIQKDVIINATYEIEDFADEKDDSIFRFSLIGTKRIPSVHLARELLLREHFSFLFKSQLDEKELSLDFGVRLWTDLEIDMRENFLVSMINNREVRNLSYIKKFYKGKKLTGLEPSYYLKSAIHRIGAYKKKRSLKEFLNLNFNEIEYLTWMKKNGAF